MYIYNDYRGLKSKEIQKAPTAELFFKRTFSRDELFMNVSHNTVDGTYKDPCTTVGGIRTGSPCTFPFVFPDCSEYFKPYQNHKQIFLFIHLIIVRTFTSKFKIKDMISFKTVDK